MSEPPEPCPHGHVTLNRERRAWLCVTCGADWAEHRRWARAQSVEYERTHPIVVSNQHGEIARFTEEEWIAVSIAVAEALSNLSTQHEPRGGGAG